MGSCVQLSDLQDCSRAQKKGNVMTEQEMRESKVPWPKEIEELTDYINGLVKQPHDYGTCVYAMSMSAVAAFYYVSHKLGVTGFQASCADMDILRRTRNIQRFQILNLEDLLYPQYSEKFKCYEDYLKENAEWLSKEAKKKLAESPEAHPNVIAHWKVLSRLVPEETEVKSEN